MEKDDLVGKVRFGSVGAEVKVARMRRRDGRQGGTVCEKLRSRIADHFGNLIRAIRGGEGETNCDGQTQAATAE